MIILYQYRVIEKNGLFYIVSQEPRFCPCCHGSVRVRDSKRRQLIFSENEIHVFQLRRLKCQVCGALHLEIPDIIIPHKHYSREVIEKALHDRPDNCPAENSTIYRWNRELKRPMRSASAYGLLPSRAAPGKQQNKIRPLKSP